MPSDPQPLARFLTGDAPSELPLNNGATLAHLPAVGGGIRPALVWIHGGAWRAGDKSGMYPQMRYFAHRGLVAFSIGYRRITTGTPAEVAAGTGLAEALADCREAIRLIRARATELGVDPARIAVAGDSAGGHLAACLAALPATTTDGSRPDAAILCNPITDLTEGAWATVASGVPPVPGQADPPPTPEQFAWAVDYSPIHQVRAPQPPTLTIHGEADRVVTPEQSRRYHARLQALGVASELVLLPEARHAFVIAGYTATPPTIVHAWRCIDGFLGRLGYLEDAPTLTV